MAYVFKEYRIYNVNKDGTFIQGATTVDPLAMLGPYEIMAIGNRVRLEIDLEATLGDKFDDVLIRLNLGLFTVGLPAIQAASAYNYGFESNGFITLVPVEGIYLGVASSLGGFKNYYAEFTKIDTTNANVTIEFYVTLDINQYSVVSPAPDDRFLLNRIGNGFNPLRNNGTSVYSTTENIGIAGTVFNYLGLSKQILDPVTSAEYDEIPVNVRWYNSDYLGVTTNMRFLQDIEITSPSQIAASLPSLTDASALSAQGATASIDPTFTVVSNSMSANEENSVEIILSGQAFNGSPNPPVTDIRVLLIRTDSVVPDFNFMDALNASEAIIPQAVVISSVLDNALATPSDWFEDVPNPDDITLQFTIDGTLLDFNGRYRIIVNVYDAANQSYVTSHISPELIANYISPVVPVITGYLSTYNKEYTGNELTIAPHQRIKASIEIDKVAYNAGLAALGFTQTFDNVLGSILCKLVNTIGVVNQVQAYIPPAVITPNLTKVTDDGATLRLEAIFRISEEYAGINTFIDWTLGFNQPLFSGSTELVEVFFRQKLTVDLFENDNLSPNLLAVRFYENDNYPTQKIQVFDICDKQQIICEVEKDPAFTGSINLVATIYPADEFGDTQPQQIEEEEDWTPIVLQMSQLASGKLDNVEVGFLGDDFATFRINVPQLTVGQRYWITGIAFEQLPNYCPLGLVSVVNGNTSWSGTITGWQFTANATNLINEITTHPDYVSGVTITVHKLTDNMDNLVGVSQNASGNTLTAVAINSVFTEVYYTLVVEAVFNSGSGNHLIRHTLTQTILRPVFNGGPVAYIMTGYECSDLG